MTISTETDGFSNEKEALEGGSRGGYYGGYFEHHVIRDISYGLWTDARNKVRLTQQDFVCTSLVPSIGAWPDQIIEEVKKS